MPHLVGIDGVATATPPILVTREDVVAVLPRLWPRLARRTALLGAELPEGDRFLLRPLDEMAISLPPAEQTARYARCAPELAADAAARALAAAGARAEDVGLVVVASCTGFVLPGVDVELVERLGIRREVCRMPFAQFGCGGGAAGLALAADWVRGHPGERALVVAVELPSLTFRADDTSIDNLMSALVFGDGAGAAVLGAGAASRGLSVGRVRSTLVPGSASLLGYDLANDGFRVILSRRLPELLADRLPAIVDGFLGVDAVRGLDAVAVHPGGPAIVDAVSRGLGLEVAQVAASRAAMRRAGNTSSAGILFVLEELIGHRDGGPGRGLAIGIGPGVGIQLLELAWDC